VKILLGITTVIFVGAEFTRTIVDGILPLKDLGSKLHHPKIITCTHLQRN